MNFDYAEWLREQSRRLVAEREADGDGPLSVLEYRNRQAIEAWRRRATEAAREVPILPGATAS